MNYVEIKWETIECIDLKLSKFKLRKNLKEILMKAGGFSDKDKKI